MLDEYGLQSRIQPKCDPNKIEVDLIGNVYVHCLKSGLTQESNVPCPQAYISLHYLILSGMEGVWYIMLPND